MEIKNLCPQIIEEKINENKPISNLTFEEHMAANGLKATTLKDVFKNIQTYEMCLAAVKKDGGELRYVSKKLIDENLCKEAVLKSGYAISCVPEKFKTEEISFIALVNNPSTINLINQAYLTDDFFKKAFEKNPEVISVLREDLITFEMCIKAVEYNGLLLKFIPKKYHCEKIYKAAIHQNSKAFIHIPENKKTKALSIKLFEENMDFFCNVPKRFITYDMCKRAVSHHWRNFLYVPEKHVTDELSVCVLDQLNLSVKPIAFFEFDKLFDKLTDKVKTSQAFQKYMLNSGIMKVKNCRFDKNLQKFVLTSWFYSDREEMKFDSLKELYKFLCESLRGVDLTEYDFKGIDMMDYDFRGAVINSDFLEKIGWYNDSFYKKTVDNAKKYIEYKPSQSMEIIPAESVYRDINIANLKINSSGDSKIYYISDLHLMHKIAKKFPVRATKEEIYAYLKTIVSDMLGGIVFKYNNYLLIAGDVSFDFEIASMFYEILVRRFVSSQRACSSISDSILDSPCPQNIVLVLGNHELWDGDAEGSRFNTLEKIVEKYRDLSESLGITFLNNELVLFSYDKLNRISEEKLYEMSDEEIEKCCDRSSLAVFGGMGFSGYCTTHNASTGLYRSAINTLESDIAYTVKFEKLYKRVRKALEKHQIIVLTHMPVENWSQDSYVSRWVYINGHTHHNRYLDDETGRVFSDNQIGYDSVKFFLKYFDFNDSRDIFENIEDGIYQISNDQYKKFCVFKKIYIQFNRQDGRIIMIKRKGIYLFLYEVATKIYILNGGKCMNIEQYDVEYYYRNMERYSASINKITEKYNNALKSIAKLVKSIGGVGSIHGSIVDIDYYNHIYLNPQTGEMLPYFAITPYTRRYYKDIPMLLKAQRTDLYNKYVEHTEENNLMLALKNKTERVFDLSKEANQDIDHFTRRLKALQYLTDQNVIRVWNEKYFLDGDIDINNIDLLKEG